MSGTMCKAEPCLANQRRPGGMVNNPVWVAMATGPHTPRLARPQLSQRQGHCDLDAHSRASQFDHPLAWLARILRTLRRWVRFNNSMPFRAGCCPLSLKLRNLIISVAATNIIPPISGLENRSGSFAMLSSSSTKSSGSIICRFPPPRTATPIDGAAKVSPGHLIAADKGFSPRQAKSHFYDSITPVRPIDRFSRSECGTRVQLFTTELPAPIESHRLR